jgi:transposase
VVDFTDSVNSQSVIRLLDKLLIKYPRKAIYLFIDNAAYYKSQLVKDWLKLHKRVKFYFLPAYSPNLNIIERLRKFFKRRFCTTTITKSFQTFWVRVRVFFVAKKDTYQR